MISANASVHCAELPTKPLSKPVVFVIRDNPSVAGSLEVIIDHAGWQPNVVASAREFLACPLLPVPNCLVLDVGLSNIDGLDLQKRIAADREDLPIIFVTSGSDVPTAVQAMKAGAIEFLTKPFHDELLLRAIQHALERSEAALLREEQMRIPKERYESLSRREREVMALVVRGHMNKQVGGDLGISEITVKAHRARAMQKMGVTSLAHLVTIAAKLDAIVAPLY